MAGDYDVVCIGRVGVDLYPLQVGVPLDEVSTFGKFLGGSPTNVAVAIAKYGHSDSIITRTGDDPFGRFVRSTLTELGVSSEFAGTEPGSRTAAAF